MYCFCCRELSALLWYSFRLIQRWCSKCAYSGISIELRLLLLQSLFYLSNPVTTLEHLQFFIFDFSYLAFIASLSFSSAEERFFNFYCFLPKFESFESLDPELFCLMDFRLRVVNNIQSLYQRMYSNAHKQNKPASKPNIFEIAGNLREDLQGRDEAQQIMAAYRKVEDIRNPIGSSNNQTKKSKQVKVENRKPESEYANKVKETLRQLNANRKKELQSNKEILRPVFEEKLKVFGSAQRHLIQSGLRKLFKLMNKKYDENIKLAMQKIINLGTSSNLQNEQNIRLWKLRRLFSAWQYETMLCKIQKERVAKAQTEKQRKLKRLAEDFNYFRTVKKFFKGWSYETKKAVKKRQFELEESLRRQQQINRMEEQKKKGSQNDRKREVQLNVELQHKLRGFLDGLKQQIEGKDRLNTIKQKTQQSEARKQIEHSSIEKQESESVHEEQSQVNQNAQQQEGQIHSLEQHHNGPLTSEQLEKKRKQLQKKAKQRKQALQKLKRDREQKKKQELEQKIALQKEMEEEQKRIKQEQYKKFVKQRRQEQQWKQKQKQLERRAIEFDRLRLMRYYGWDFWAKLKKQNINRAEVILNGVSKLFLRKKLQTFINNLMEIGEIELKKAQSRANSIYLKKLKKKCIQKLKEWKNTQIDLKDQLEARHEVHTLKVYFRQWQRTRNQIQLENYEWERPRLKRAQCLHAMTLMYKSFEALKINRDEQIQNRNIEQHKAKIKEKVHDIVKEKPTINYDDFL